MLPSVAGLVENPEWLQWQRFALRKISKSYSDCWNDLSRGPSRDKELKQEANAFGMIALK